MVAAIVPAAGAGTRLGGPTRKPFVLLHGEPLVVHTLRVLQASPLVRWILVVVPAAEQSAVKNFLARYQITKALAPCTGGASRAESVARGFAQVPAAARWVLVHDAARPCVNRQLIEATIRRAKRVGAVACGLPASVTVKAADEQGLVRVTLDREQLWFVQTPQVFRRDWFSEALARVGQRLDQYPDDASILEAAGFPVQIMPGDPLNIKVTTKDDLMLAETILNRRARGQTISRRRVVALSPY